MKPKRQGWTPVLVVYDDMQRVFNNETNALAYAKSQSKECKYVAVSVNGITIAEWIEGVHLDRWD